MQPYLFPYMGYFQLINAVDTFVIHDDVQYIKSGWINRNRFLLNGKEYLFTFSVKKNAFTRFINQRYYSDKFEMEKGKFLRVLKQAYCKAPFYNKIFSLMMFGTFWECALFFWLFWLFPRSSPTCLFPMVLLWFWARALGFYSCFVFS